MKYVFLFLILIASISLTVPAFAEIEKGINFDKQILQTYSDGSQKIKATFLSYNRILDGNDYKDYIFTETASKLKITTARGFIELDKTSCAFNLDDKLTDSIIAFNGIVNNYSFNTVNQINSATCEAYYNISEKSLIAKRYASGVGFMEYKYIFKNGEWKTQLEATNLTNLTNRVFAFDQTIDLNRDTIQYGGNTKNLDDFNGQTFTRTWLENNQGKIINLLNGNIFDFDLGFNLLDSISVTDTGINKSKLTFHYMRNNDILMPNETLIIDPTFTDTTGSDGRAYTGGVLGAVCDPTFNTSDGTFNTYKQETGSGGLGSCQVGWVVFDLSTLTGSETISSASIEFDVVTLSGAPGTCDLVISSTNTPGQQMVDDGLGTGAPAGTMAQETWNNCDDGVANGYTVSISAGAFPEILNWAGGDITFLPTLDSWARTGAPDSFIDFRDNDMILSITYTTIPAPDSITDLTLVSATSTTATVSFTNPDLHGETLQTRSFYLQTPQTNNVITFKINSTANPITFTGLTLGTPYSLNGSSATAGGYNFTAVNILNFTTATHAPPGAPTLSAVALSDSAIRYTSVPGTAGANSTLWYGLRCNLNGAGSWNTIISNSSYVSFYEYTGLTLGDINICQWRDGSVDGFSAFSNNATAELVLDVLQGQRTSQANPDDKLIAFIEMVSNMGGVYFGLGAIPFGVMLIGFMAGKKTVRIFTIATLFLMGILHASGYYVYPGWYWTLALLLGIILVMGRMKSD